jgi:peptidoglycan/LPS O-acetylase OafA/YrhL
VEEQFNLVWPLGLYFLAKFRAKNAPTALGAVGALSLIASIAYFNIDQDAVFFLTPFRAFELAVGGLLVWIERASKRRTATRFQSWVSALSWSL